MWAAALIGLAVGGPLGVCLMLAAGITAGIKSWKVDAEHAKTGQMPPSHRLIEKWLDGRKARGQAPKDAKPAKYGSLAYARQRWQAMWEDLGETHRDVRDRYKKAVADAKANGKPLPPKPTMKETLKGWKWEIDDVAPPVAAKPSGQSSPDAPATVSGAPARPSAVPAAAANGKPAAATPAPVMNGRPSPRPTPIPDYPQAENDPRVKAVARSHAPRCPRCGRPMKLAEDHTDRGTHAAYYWCCGRGEHGRLWNGLADEARDRQNGHPPQTEAPRPFPLKPAGARPVAVLTPFNPQPNRPTEGDNMTQSTTESQQSGEVTGLASAINYADAVAAAHLKHSAGGGEQYRASLGKAEVGEETIQSAADAQEASQIAGAKWTAHADKLRQQLAAKEVTTSETGTKEFLLAE